MAILAGGTVGFGLFLLVRALSGLAAAPPAASRILQRLRGTRLTRRLAASVGAGIVMRLLTGWPVAAILAAAAGFTVPAAIGHRSADRGELARIEALASWTESLRDTIAAAAGLEQAIVATAEVAPAAIASQAMRLAARLEGRNIEQESPVRVRRGSHRWSLKDALRAFADELADPTADLVVAALTLASQKQAGNLTEVLTALSGSAREQAILRLKTEAGRARTRTAVRVVIGTTLSMAGGLILLSRDYLDSYDTAAGQMVLALVGGCFFFSLLWLSKLGRFRQPQRILTPTVQARP